MAILTGSSYAEVPKYRCPRCTTRTCSLPCYKRHQQRASCSGKRDPAAYVKKSQLATPSSIDRDYNYLKGIEKSIDDASVDARERVDDQSRYSKREGAFQRYLTDNRISVEYAPKGMSRQKNNRSRVTKNDKIYWTIEWRDESGEQDLRHDADHTSTLRDLYRGVQMVKRKRNIARAAAINDESESRKKRKTDEAVGSPQESEKTEHHNLDASSSAVDEVLHPVPVMETEQQHEHHFYLRKPSGAGSSIVVVPLDPASTLTQALSGQTVQEYPTILALHEPSDRLPNGIVLERDYRSNLSRAGKSSEAQTSHSLQASTQPSPRPVDRAEIQERLDANAILDMLKRDVGV